jgi:hypothetical protein
MHRVAKLRRRFTLLAVVVGLLLFPALLSAQTVPPVPTPVAPIPTTVPTPEPPTEVTPDAPGTVTLDPQLGASAVITASASTSTQLSIAIEPATLQNLTDINGNPVQAARLEVLPFTQDQASVLGELPAAALADSGTLDRRLGDVIRIQLFDAAGNVIQRPNFNPPITLCFTPNAEQIAAAGGLNAIEITKFDSLLGAWVVQPTTVIGEQLCSSITSLSFFILSARPVVVEPTVQPLPIPARLPNTDGTGMLGEWLLVLLVLLALPLGWWLRRSVG